MDKNLHILRQRYSKAMVIILSVSILMLLVPFIWNSEGVLLTFGYVVRLFENGAGATAMLFIIIFLSDIAGILFSLLFRRKYSAVAAGACILNFICVFGFMLVAKSVTDKAGILASPFLIKDLSIAYWLMLLCGLAGMICSFKTAKISRGYIALSILSVIWVFPIFFILLTSFRAEQGFYVSYLFPKNFTFSNYIKLLTEDSIFPYARWFANTLFVAVASCIISTLIILSSAYTISRVRFKQKRFLMSALLILGMFPGFMSMIAVYYILKALGLSQSLFALILVYSGGSILSYYIVKGYFDTIPRAIEEAACIDGATKLHVFIKIILPLSKPIIIYTILTSFMAPWGDFIFARVILGDKYMSYTVAVGLYQMLEPAFLEQWYTRFAAGAILIAVPIAVLFISMQKYYMQGMTGAVKG